MKWITKEGLAVKRPKRGFPQGFDFRQHTREVAGRNGVIAEFIGSGDFAAAFNTRQMYEIEAGRDEEPILYTTIYDVVESADLPEIMPISVLGPAGVVFEEVHEGGEVKFATVGQSDKSVTIKQYAVGFEYTKKLIMFNQVWEFPRIERQFGQAFNALLNHIHLYPIINYTYKAANKTSASSTGTLLEEKFARTIEDAIVAAKTDSSNPRRGPYDLLIAGGDMFTVERALKLRIQDGANPNGVPGASYIDNVIVYDGWTGSMGGLSTSYTGVTKGTAYLISKQYEVDFKSYVKQGLQSARGDGDLSRFIVEQIVWDAWLGHYAAPAHAVEEITWPTS
jgi:hypothetical protein